MDKPNNVENDKSGIIHLTYFDRNRDINTLCMDSRVGFEGCGLMEFHNPGWSVSLEDHDCHRCDRMYNG